MEHYKYSITINENPIEIFAFRKYWGKEQEIYQSVQNAYVLKEGLEQMFFIPINAEYPIGSTPPTVVIGGVLNEQGETCANCINRIRYALSGCSFCKFAPTEENPVFNKKELEETLNKFTSKPINILDVMVKRGIYETYNTYHLKSQYLSKIMEEIGKKSNPILEEVIRFMEKFNVKVVFETEKEIYFESDGEVYLATMENGKINNNLKKMGITEIEKNIGLAKQEIEKQKVKLTFLEKYSKA